MAGFREFVTGEVLTAANVDDFLMKQTVMKFADAGARDTALGTAVGGGNALREGMVAYLDDTDDLLKYDGSAWAAIGAAGIGSNVVGYTDNTVFTTSSTSFVDATDYSVTITPTSVTSKILILCTAVLGTSSSTGGSSTVRAAISRNGTTIGVDTNGFGGGGNGTDALGKPSHATFQYIDSPATTSATTYNIQIRATSAIPVFLGRSRATDGDYWSSIVAIEVSA